MDMKAVWYTSCGEGRMKNKRLASSQLGPATAHGVGILVMHVIYMERYIHIPKFRSVGPSAAAGEVETYGRKES